MARKTNLEEPKESTIVKNILKTLKKEYPGVWYKIHGGPYQERGIPDIIGCYKGTFCGIEVKRPSKRRDVSAYQEEQLQSIELALGLSGVVTSVEEALILMENHFSGKKTI